VLANFEMNTSDTMSLTTLCTKHSGIEGTAFTDDRERVVFNYPIFYIDSIHKENKTTFTSAENTVIINELEKVILHVEQSGHSSSEKEEIKRILREFTHDVHTKTLDITISNLKEKFKQYFDAATPYLQMLFSHFLQM
jgi:hypothetical protein